MAWLTVDGISNNGHIKNAAIKKAEARLLIQQRTIPPSASLPSTTYDTKPDHVLLRAFRRTGDLSLREFIFFRWRKRAASAARKYFNHHMPYAPLLSVDDLESGAMIGLLKAIDTFDPDRNDSFLGWMQIMVKWAIIDELRQLQHFPRLIAHNRRLLKDSLADLMQELKHKPTLEDIRTHLGQAAFEIAADPLFFCNVFNQALDKGHSYFYATAEYSLADTLLDDSAAIPSLTLREDLEKLVLTLLEGQQRSVVYQYYFIGLTVSEIAKSLNISTTSVSEKRYQGLATLREKILEQ